MRRVLLVFVTFPGAVWRVRGHEELCPVSGLEDGRQEGGREVQAVSIQSDHGG